MQQSGTWSKHFLFAVNAVLSLQASYSHIGHHHPLSLISCGWMPDTSGGSFLSARLARTVTWSNKCVSGLYVSMSTDIHNGVGLLYSNEGESQSIPHIKLVCSLHSLRLLLSTFHSFIYYSMCCCVWDPSLFQSVSTVLGYPPPLSMCLCNN